MTLVLAAAGVYCLSIALWFFVSPERVFATFAPTQPGHPLLVQVIGIFYFVFSLSFFLAAPDPPRHWRIVLLCTLKICIVISAALYAFFQQTLSWKLLLLLAVDDVIWLLPFLLILWAVLQERIGRTPAGVEPLSVSSAAESYMLSSGETLEKASQQQLVILVFLRHFGCTFTRQLLRGLEHLEAQAEKRQARLVLVHMLQSGKETQYIGDHTEIARIADPRCELYRAFGLGKAGIWELFGPRVWYRGLMALIHGCGVGHLAGDGLQMPGVFLFKNNQIVAAQPAKSASDLPDLQLLFEAES
jgi:hypothetical protein